MLIDQMGVDPSVLTGELDVALEELLAEFDDVAAADAVAHRERDDRGLQAGPERAGSDAVGQRPVRRARNPGSERAGTDAR